MFLPIMSLGLYGCTEGSDYNHKKVKKHQIRVFCFFGKKEKPENEKQLFFGEIKSRK